ncbi:MAG: polysaccharide biosynthesis protein [Ruminococcaceae bacterium]|nr:polysaccharide biosynthesis protein [Oscillospiraceae bacterium]
MEANKQSFLQRNRRAFLIIFDILTLTATYLIPWIAISGRTSLEAYRGLLFSSTVLFVLCYVTVFVLTGMYDSLWRYAEIYEFFRVVVASVMAIGIFILVTVIIYNETSIPKSVYLMSSLFSSSVTLYSRLTYRMLRNTRIERAGKQRNRVLIVGAGEAASTLIHEIFKDPYTDYNIVCAVDDNPQKLSRTIMGVKIMGTTRDIPNLVKQCNVDTLLVAMPSVDEVDKKRILNICSKTRCNIRLLPDITRLISSGKDLLDAVRDVKVEDLLGRDEVVLATEGMVSVIGKVVMVTGGGGSIGSELCRQIAASNPKRLILVDISENSAYEVQQDLRMKYGDKLDLVVKIASVRDSKKVDAMMREERPQVIFHAAAHKHVPLMETSPEEAVKNNVCGTFNLVDSADRYGVEKFIFISTDKAVNPTSVMGATKRICEMILMSKNAVSDTVYSSVRFGNVLGSNGSVIPLFKNQIAAGGPVTVTHPDVVRYFMTISEAVNLVIQAADIAVGGEVFVLDMGYQVKILDLAENLIRMAGFLPYRDIEIEFTGLRPGEKLYEELVLSEEGTVDTVHSKIFIVKSQNGFDAEGIEKDFWELKALAYSNDEEGVLEKMAEMVPTFKRSRLRV